MRFAGETMFASGQWAGIELDDESGKNDGSHGGIRYFSCKPKRGKERDRDRGRESNRDRVRESILFLIFGRTFCGS